MNGIFQDVRYALRQLWKSPGFTAAAVLTLALGIGANTAIFSVIEAVILRPLPYRDTNRLINIRDLQDPQEGGFLFKDYQNLRAESTTLEDSAIYYRDSGFSQVTLTDANEPRLAQGAYVSANFFPLMGVTPELGRTFTSREDAQKERVVILSHGLWAREFGASLSAIGGNLRINGVNSRIIGVMPETFQFPASDQQFWAPLTTNPHWDDPSLLVKDPHRSRGFYARWQIVSRLKPGVSMEQAGTELGTLFRQFEQSDPDANRGAGIRIAPVRVELNSKTRLALSVLFAAVLFVLLIACVNVANLVLARGSARQSEISLRISLGAGRSRVVRQLFTESILLALFSGVVGSYLAYLGLHAALAWVPAGIPRLEQMRLDGGVLSFTLAASIIAAVLFGLFPAWRISGMSESLHLAGRASARSQRLGISRNILIIAEFALTVVLLIGAGLLAHSYLRVEAVDLGFDPAHVFTLHIQSNNSSSARNAFFEGIDERLRTLPGVQAVGAIDGLFETGDHTNLGLRDIEGRSPEPKQLWTPLQWNSVRGAFFQAMGIRLLQGRYFGIADTPNAPLVAIIDESAAHRYWPKENPLGKRFRGQDPRGKNDDWITVVGVVSDARRSGPEQSPIPHIYQPYTQAIDGDRTSDLVVRGHGDSRELPASIHRLAHELAPSAVLSPVTTMEDQLSEQLAPRRFQTLLLAAFGMAALLLASLGIYGMLSYSMAQRTHEIGVRMALGAQQKQVVSLVVREGTKYAAIGLAIGIVGAAALTKFMASLLFGTTSTDPATFLLVAVVLMLVALFACYIPARRAAKVDPMVALRYE